MYIDVLVIKKNTFWEEDVMFANLFFEVFLLIIAALIVSEVVGFICLKDLKKYLGKE